jgi:hypothetical protein
MCEYCGCQSVTAIDELTREHDMVVNMIGDVRTAHAAGDVVRMAELARRIAAVLRPHTEVEEHGLFPATDRRLPRPRRRSGSRTSPRRKGPRRC